MSKVVAVDNPKRAQNPVGLRRFRLPLIIGAIVAILALIYEVALNVFLMTGALGRTLSRDPDKILVEYSSGWSFLPGDVHARGLRIRSKDGNVEFDLRISQCEFHVVLSELLRKRFHVTRVHGRGITFVARRRIDPADATAETLETLPRIDGLEAVPLRGIPTPPPDDAHYNLVTVALDHVDAEAVHEVWIDSMRFEGDAHIVGGFFLRPIRWASVGPATAYVSSGRVTMAKDVVATDTRGRLETTVDGFDPRETQGAAVLHRTSVRLVLDAGLPSLAFLHRFVHGGAAIGGGVGALNMDVRVDHGRIAAPSQLEADARGVDVVMPVASIAGNVYVSAKTTGLEATDPLEGAVTLRSVRFATRGFEAVPVRVDRTDLWIHSSELDLVEHPFSDAALSMRLPVAQIADARFVDAWLDSSGASARVQGGRGTLGAELEIARGTGKGQALLALDDATVDVGKNESITGRVRAEVRLPRWNLGSGRMDLAGTRIEVLGVSVTGGTANWWANVELPASDLELHRHVWRGRVVAQARDTRPFVSGLLAAKGLPNWIAPLASAGDLHATAQVEINAASDAIDVRDLGATAGSFRMQAMLSKHSSASHLLALVGFGPAVVGIESAGGDTHVQISDVDSWYQRRAHPDEP